MKLYAIRNYDSGIATGYYIGAHGPLTFTTRKAAEIEAAKLNTLPHATDREYRAEPIQD